MRITVLDDYQDVALTSADWSPLADCDIDVVTSHIDDVDELVARLGPWGEAMRAAGGYVGGPVDLWPNRR
jgi:hypothetical protein